MVADPPYRRLRTWQAALQLIDVVYRVSASWPKTEQYGLTSQSQRAAVSIAVNIAEGSARQGPREFARFLGIAFGSLTELQCLMDIARHRGMLGEGEWEEVEVHLASTGKRLWRLLLPTFSQQYTLEASRRPGV